MLAVRRGFRVAAFAARRETKIHRFADVAVGFGPSLPTSKTSTAESSNRRRSRIAATRSSNWQRSSNVNGPMFEKHGAPLSLRFRLRESGLGNQANDLIWCARIQRRQQFVGPTSLPSITSGCFCPKRARTSRKRCASFPVTQDQQNLSATHFCRYRPAAFPRWRRCDPFRHPERSRGSRYGSFKVTSAGSLDGARDDRRRRRILPIYQITRITQQLGC